MVKLLKPANPLDPFSNHFTYLTPSSNRLSSRSQSFPDFRFIDRQSNLSHQGDIWIRPSTLPKNRLIARSPPTSVKYTKDGRREMEKSMASMKASEQSKKSEDVNFLEASDEKNTKDVINLNIQGDMKEVGGENDKRNNMKYVTDLTADYDSSEDTTKTQTTLNEFFLAERQKDLTAIAKCKLLKEQQKEEKAASIKKTIQRRATRAKVWLTPTQAVNASFKLSVTHHHPLQRLVDPESQNVSITTVNTSILFPSSPIRQTSPPSSPTPTRARTLSPSIMQTANSRKVPFPPRTATRFEIQDWLHALFRAHQTPPLPPFSLYHLNYTGLDLHRMAFESTLEAADLTREFVAEILKTGGVSVRQAEIVHWEILSFGDEVVKERREGRGVRSMKSVSGEIRRSLDARRSSSSARQRSECADQERRVKMVPYIKDALLSPEILAGKSEMGVLVGDGERNMGVNKKGMSVRRRRVKNLVKGLVGLRISVKVEFNAAGKDRMLN